MGQPHGRAFAVRRGQRAWRLGTAGRARPHPPSCAPCPAPLPTSGSALFSHITQAQGSGHTRRRKRPRSALSQPRTQGPGAAPRGPAGGRLCPRGAHLAPGTPARAVVCRPAGREASGAALILQSAPTPTGPEQEQDHGDPWGNNARDVCKSGK